METNVIYCEDCISGLDRIADGSVDAVITDPPFNISQRGGIDRSGLSSPSMRRESDVRLDFGEWDHFDRLGFLEFTRTWMKKCARVLRDGGAFVSFFDQANISMLNWIGFECGIVTRTMFTWKKTNPVPSIRQVNWLSSCEWAFVGTKGKDGCTFNFTTQNGMHNFYETPNKSVYGVTDHPNEKPVDLIERFVLAHTKEGDVVLDPFMGSGTTAVACLRRGRRYVGFERDERYCDMARRRVEDDSPLFAASGM